MQGKDPVQTGADKEKVVSNIVTLVWTSLVNGLILPVWQSGLILYLWWCTAVGKARRQTVEEVCSANDNTSFSWTLAREFWICHQRTCLGITL